MFCITVISTLGISIRVAAVKTKRMAIALMLFNLIVLIGRFSNQLMVPFIGSMADVAREGLLLEAAKFGSVEAAVSAGSKSLQHLLLQYRTIIFSTTLGAVAGGLLTPLFVRFFSQAIETFERTRSLARTFFSYLLPHKFIGLIRQFYLPPGQRLKDYLKLTIPKGFLVFNVFVVGFYTIGLLSSIYAGALAANAVTTANMLSGIVNGIATVLLFTNVDPSTALITDECIADKRPVRDIKVMTLYMVITTILGTILAQLLFSPMADYVAVVAKFIYQITKQSMI